LRGSGIIGRMRRWTILAALGAGAFASRLWVLARSAEPAGTDGYYYVVQVEHWLRTGHLKVPDGSWVLRLCAAWSYVLGDPVMGVKVTAALLAALCVPAAWALGGGLDRMRGLDARPTAWWLAAWAAASPSLTTLAAEFPKNLGAAAPLLVVAAVAVHPSRRAPALAAAFAAVLLAATAHRTGAVLWIPIAVAALGRRPLLLLGIAGALVAFAVLSWALPNLLHPSDLPRVTEQLDWPRLLPAFARQARPAQVVELSLPWFAVVASAAAWVRHRRHGSQLLALALPSLCCIVPIWRTDTLDLGYRLALLSPLFGVPLLLAAMPERAVRLASTARAAIALAGLAVVGVLLAAPSGFNGSANPPHARYRRVVDAMPRPLPPLLIAHQGFSFLYTHLTGADAMAWAPEPELDRKEVGRLAWGIRPSEWVALAPDPPPIPLDPEYAYVREDVWEVFVSRAQVEGDDDLRERLSDWRNPSRVRPASLLRNRGL
jgi:hypothetical protein